MGSPIEYPRVTVGGSPYQIKFGFAAWVKLDSWGLNKDIIAEWFSGRKLAVMISLAAAGLGSYDDSGDWKTADFSMVKLSDVLEKFPDEIPLIAKAVDASLKKRLAEIESAKAAANPAPLSPVAQ